MARKFQFTKAVKEKLYTRIALAGPSGSGKTMTSLIAARELVGPEGRILLVDTERRSASLYADLHDFDTVDFEAPYDPRELIALLDAATREGYDAVIIDSLSHFWVGDGGLLDIVDQAGGSFQKGWKAGTPIQNKMVEKVLSYPGHIIATMRSKTTYVVNEKNQPEKVGTAPVQREGMDYEFTVVLDIDRKHNITVDKSRCPELTEVGVFPGTQTAKYMRLLADWLDGGAVPTIAQKDAKVGVWKQLVELGWSMEDGKAEAARVWSEWEHRDAERPTREDYNALLARLEGPATDEDPFAPTDDDDTGEGAAASGEAGETEEAA